MNSRFFGRGLRLTALACVLLTSSITAFAQRWTAEQQQVLDFSEQCWEAWQKTVNNQDHKIWLKACPMADGFAAWWTSDGALWNEEANMRNFDSFVRDVKNFQWENIQPLKIEVHGDFALMWFYATYAQDDASGRRTRFEDKRFEVFRRVDGQWQWAGGMVAAKAIGNFVEN